MNVGKKDDEFGDSPFSYHVDKSVVLQEARAFNESPINPRKCRVILAKLVFLLYQSETLGTKEATETFFGVTKLFQSSDIPLRQMVYLAIKELSVFAEDVIIVTSSLTKDINTKMDAPYRPNAIRALCKITDPSMVQSIERFFKQAIVDKNSSVSSAALVSSLHLFQASKEAVKRWVNEVQEAINGRGGITQYHALGLLYLIKAHDRMSVIKLIQGLSRSSSLRSPFAFCMLIRYTAKMMADRSLAPSDYSAGFEMLLGWVRHKADMVAYEAARAICQLAAMPLSETDARTSALSACLPTAVSALQVMLVSHRTVLRFAAVRALNRLALVHPTRVASTNLDMEKLVSDSNRSIATMAITSLLKTGSEGSVDRLLKQITSFMADISDEFKIIVVDAVRSLCLKFPLKHQLMLTFLSNILRDEGDYEYKRAIVQALLDIVEQVPDSVEYALSQLSEFIEDCEYTRLAVRVLHLLGRKGPYASKPSKYIRYIYNRVLLENATVRAAAVSALAHFALALPDMRARVVALIRRCTDDPDDEVRDRAALLLGILSSDTQCRRYVASGRVYAWAALEDTLVGYLSDARHLERPVDLGSVPTVSVAEDERDRRARVLAAAAGPSVGTLDEPGEVNGDAKTAGEALVATSVAATGVAEVAAAPASDSLDAIAGELAQIPALASCGALFKASRTVHLTEADTEYVVNVVKYVFDEHLVLRFSVTNTLPDYRLKQVRVGLQLAAGGGDDPLVHELQQEAMLPIDTLAVDETKPVHVVFRRPRGGAPVTASFSCVLRFRVYEVDPASGELVDEDGYDDEYSLEDLDLVIGDYMRPVAVPSFAEKWAAMDPAAASPHGAFEAVETYQLTAAVNIKSAVAQLLEVLGMAPLEGTGAVPAAAHVAAHQLLLSGVFVRGVPCLARCRMLYDQSNGVALELAVRSSVLAVSERLADAVA